MSLKNPKFALSLVLLAFLAAVTWGAIRLRDASSKDNPTIALVPRTSGALIWELAYAGAARAAELHRANLYQHTPTSETDIAGQASLLDRVSHGNYRGLILAPNHSYFLLSSLKKVLESGIPVVVISDALEFPPMARFTQFLNDNDQMGEFAAAELARLIGGRGTIVIAGLTRSSPGIVKRTHAAEQYLHKHHPQIRWVTHIPGAYIPTSVEESTRTRLAANPEISGILGLTASATRGAYAALKSQGLNRKIPLIGCEQDSDLLGALAAGEIAALVAEDTRLMGRLAVEAIASYWAGRPLPHPQKIAPVLLTKENNSQSQHRHLTSSAP